jgi:5-methylthioadenosine/S-adenosylhomocysteine deaminase
VADDPDLESASQLADVHIVDGLIDAIRPPGGTPPLGAEVIDLGGRWLIPGFVQTHIHLVQTLFRGLADDLALLDWLRTRIWPLEKAHDEDSVYWSARLGITELLLGGSTAILDMATVSHTDAVFRAAEEAGIRAFIGKAQMDLENEAGLSEPTDRSMASACELADRWHRRTPRLAYAFAPRFVPSCSAELLRQTVAEARRRGCLLHTHASENLDEVAMVRAMTGRDNVEWLDALGFSGRDVVLAHCVHLTAAEERLLARTGTTVAHCPSSNLKLASGFARIPELLAGGVRVTLGADGAPCNNRLDAFTEMRLAALIQKPRVGAARMDAPTVLGMATRRGAEALGLATGRIEVGRPADLVEIDPDVISGWGGGDPRSAIVYALTPAAVRRVWIHGERVVEGGAVRGWDNAETVAGCRSALARVRRRAGL